MLRLPRTLQQIHTFEKAGAWYVANFQTGDVFQIDAVTADILTLCSTDHNASIVKKLSGKYSEGQILESMKALEGHIETLLFEPETGKGPLATVTQEKLRLLIPHGFMKYKETLSATTNVGIYNLLTVLTKYAEVFVEINNDETTTAQREQLIALGIQFVSDLFESADAPFYASNRFIIEKCDGILSLSPHPYEEINYFRNNTIPVVSRIYSDRNWREEAINKMLCHHALNRIFDRVCPDTPWMKDELAVLTTSHLKGLNTIPDGVDLQVYSPRDSQEAREVVAEILGEKSVLGSQLVGIINGFQPQNSIGMIAEIANLHKDVVFIVFDPILERDFYQRHPNVFYINLHQPEDTIALPWIYNACEFIIFPTVIGTPFSMMLEAFACGVPGIGLTLTTLPEGLAEGLISIPLTQDDTTGKFIIPTAALSEQINVLLGTSEIRENLSTKARKIAKNYSWDRTAQCFVALFADLNKKRKEIVTPKYPDVTFAPYYDKGQNVVKTGAMQLEGFFKQRVEEGLAQTLLSEHTPEEVQTVLQYLLGDADEADRLLSILIP